MENEMQVCICLAFIMPTGNAAAGIFFNVAGLLKRSGGFGLLLRMRISFDQVFF